MPAVVSCPLHCLKVQARVSHFSVKYRADTSKAIPVLGSQMCCAATLSHLEIVVADGVSGQMGRCRMDRVGVPRRVLCCLPIRAADRRGYSIMGTELRAFLMVNTGTAWTILVHKEFEHLLATWMRRPNVKETTGVFHVGFVHPPARDFNSIVEDYRGRLLVTASAKFCLPGGYTASEREVGYVQTLPIHLGVRGWATKCLRKD